MGNERGRTRSHLPGILMLATGFLGEFSLSAVLVLYILF